MCGIAGFFDAKISQDEGLSIASKMGFLQQHRGPDGFGVWNNNTNSLYFSHRRLAILDLTEAGRQPMHSGSGRYVIDFNGEIYNHLEIRAKLRFVRWQGHSDTETLLQAFEEWGIEKTLDAIKGMFAIALWDVRENCLYLIRDRMGEKPLYYGWNNGVFYFTSELRSLKGHPRFDSSLDAEAIRLYLKYGYIPAPFSIYKGIYKLMPGCLLKIGEDELRHQVIPIEKMYWSYIDKKKEGEKNPFLGNYDDALGLLANKLERAVCQQMISDVPLGAFLSGGIDSSLIVSLMQKNSSNKIQTFTIGFNEKKFDESEHAAAVASYLGTDHQMMLVDEKAVLDMVPEITKVWDEPFADVSMLPTYFLAQFTRRKVTVSLSGDAGDELFGGYKRYAIGEKLLSLKRRVPTVLLNGLGLASEGLSHSRFSGARFAERLNRMSWIFRSQSGKEVYQSLISAWGRPEDILLNKASASDLVRWMPESGDISNMMLYDSMVYLPDDILVKVDRASMAASLESRVPFLDKDVVEFSLSLPMDWRYGHGKGKVILKDLLYKNVPKELVDRPKVGFGVPIESWLRSGLKDWASNLLFDSSAAKMGFLRKDIIDNLWSEHQEGKRNWAVQLWPILMLYSWINQNEL